MRIMISLAMLGLTAPLALVAQTANPVVSAAQEIFAADSKYIVAAVEQMPADKYSFHPTPDQWSFGKIASHVALGSNAVCSMLSGTPAPQGAKVSETDSKDTLVAAIKSSFDYCDKTLASLQDSKLSDSITFFRGRQTTRARALLELTVDLSDHYSQMASYLRLNGMTPPSAKPKN
jgi:uncharacterized damage-inducible protein DinB